MISKHVSSWRVRPGLLLVLLACGFSAFFSASYDTVVAETQDGQLSSGQVSVSSQSGAGQVALEKKLQLIDTMLTSGLSERVTMSNNDSAKRAVGEIREMYHSARQALKNGDFMLSEQWIAKAFISLSRVSREVKDAGRVNEVNKKEYERALERTRAFMRSYDQVVSEGEKKQGSSKIFDRQQYQNRMDEASSYAGTKDYVQATRSIRQALELIEAALVKVRASQTLVGSLDFNDPEVSYLYEKDRNESNRRLLTIVIRQYEDDPGEAQRLKLINGMRTRADEQRAQAELSARSGDYASASRMMESSTRSLVQAQHLSGFSLGQ